MKTLYGCLLALLLWSGVVLAGDTRLVEKARSQIGVTLSYDPEYRTMPYPGGDVPIETGVCTDVVIRAMRGLGLDLQKEVHEDMKKNFSRYPRKWSAGKTDRNIDHRRVPNLMTWFARKGWTLPASRKKEDYQPGDIVCWNLGGGITHIGIVSDKKEPDGTPLIIHNIGAGTREENMLFDYEIIGRYRPVFDKKTA